MDCRPGCAACCVVISISSALPGHPDGKPPGVRCSNLAADDRCRLWGTPDYPAVCRNFPAAEEHCGTSRSEALERLSALELATRAEWQGRLGIEPDER